MRKKSVKVRRAQTRYLVVQEEVSSGPRTQFTTPEDAYLEAEGLLSGRVRYGTYRPPRRLLVVQVVGAVEVGEPLLRRVSAAKLAAKTPHE